MLLVNHIVVCLASSIHLARQRPPAKINLPSADLSDGSLMRLPSLETQATEPAELDPPVSATAVSVTPWISEYLEYKAKMNVPFDAFEATLLLTPMLQGSKHLNTKITNYGSKLSNNGDLLSFTRHLVELLKQHYAEKLGKEKSSSSAPEDLDIEKFIKYLIEHKGFTEDQLEFLRRPELDHGQDVIEKELTRIKQKQGPPKRITVGGELSNEGHITTMPIYTCFLFLLSIIL